MKRNPESSDAFLEKSKVRKTLVQQFEELYALVPGIKTTKSGGKFTKYSVHYDLVSKVRHHRTRRWLDEQGRLKGDCPVTSPCG